MVGRGRGVGPGTELQDLATDRTTRTTRLQVAGIASSSSSFHAVTPRDGSGGSLIAISGV
jgi:hypothetical protein